MFCAPEDAAPVDDAAPRVRIWDLLGGLGLLMGIGEGVDLEKGFRQEWFGPE